MVAKPSGAHGGRKRSVDYNLEKPPLQAGVDPEDETAKLRGLARWKRWDIRHWSVPAAMLMLLVAALGVVLVLELWGVRLVSPMIDELLPR
jgi:hypothetical protein